MSSAEKIKGGSKAKMNLGEQKCFWGVYVTTQGFLLQFALFSGVFFSRGGEPNRFTLRNSWRVAEISAADCLLLKYSYQCRGAKACREQATAPRI